MSEKSLRNQANHGFLAWAEDPRGRKGALPLERMRKRWRAGHSGVYSFVAGQAKWKSRLIMCIGPSILCFFHAVLPEMRKLLAKNTPLAVAGLKRLLLDGG